MKQLLVVVKELHTTAESIVKRSVTLNRNRGVPFCNAN
jgi:hypothetical protein